MVIIHKVIQNESRVSGTHMKPEPILAEGPEEVLFSPLVYTAHKAQGENLTDRVTNCYPAMVVLGTPIPFRLGDRGKG